MVHLTGEPLVPSREREPAQPVVAVPQTIEQGSFWQTLPAVSDAKVVGHEFRLAKAGDVA